MVNLLFSAFFMRSDWNSGVPSSISTEPSFRISIFDNSCPKCNKAETTVLQLTDELLPCTTQVRLKWHQRLRVVNAKIIKFTMIRSRHISLCNDFLLLLLLLLQSLVGYPDVVNVLRLQCHCNRSMSCKRQGRLLHRLLKRVDDVTPHARPKIQLGLPRKEWCIHTLDMRFHRALDRRGNLSGILSKGSHLKTQNKPRLIKLNVCTEREY